MGYINRILQQKTGWQVAAIRWKKLGAKIRWVLFGWGLPVFDWDIFYAAGWKGYPEKTVMLEDGQWASGQYETTEWLNETIMRAPIVLGFDIQVVKIKVMNEDGKVLAEQGRMVDKHGWKKEARAEMEKWLEDTLTDLRDHKNIVIGVGVNNFGRMLLAAREELREKRRRLGID